MSPRTDAPIATQMHETHDEAIARLAVKAAEVGVHLFTHGESPRQAWYAASVTKPGVLYRVTLYSCECRGFCKWQRCIHYAALLLRFNSVPQPAAPQSELAVA